MKRHNNNKLYLMIQDTTTGRWFGLDRTYSVLISDATAQAAHAVRAEHKPVGKESNFFPSFMNQAPAWAWYYKAMNQDVFSACWFDDGSGRGVPVGGLLLDYGCTEIQKGRVLEGGAEYQDGRDA